ncbi:hypothetical protein HK100_002673 [Physocladia obscura]|uniref:Uncharacterized protein n=1 Tax=Physocladia obscura TaxID=109957 RepID=A0AAD5SV23_9FUNG|nr:hypothetical protein HK100_002673 [Physocladia obscura]
MRFSVLALLRAADLALIGIAAMLAHRIWQNILETKFTTNIYNDNSNSMAPNDICRVQQKQQQQQRRAYATLCFGDATVPGVRVLFAALHAIHAQADFVALTNNISSESATLLKLDGIKILTTLPLSPQTYYMWAKKRAETEARDAILWSKLRAWQLTQYDKVVMLDADLLVLENIDELFQMPEVSASPMVHTSEKISFYKSCEYGMKARNKIDRKSRDPSLLEGWSGLNSGVTVLNPSNETFTRLLNELSIIPNRPCCPSQEFIYNFFEERKQYFRLPAVYNSRIISAAGGGGADPDEQETATLALKQYVKVYHFVGTKPWKKRDSSAMNKLWWKYFDALPRSK